MTDTKYPRCEEAQSPNPGASRPSVGETTRESSIYTVFTAEDAEYKRVCSVDVQGSEESSCIATRIHARYKDLISIARANALLAERGVRVWGWGTLDENIVWYDEARLEKHKREQWGEPSVQALLIAVQPIVRDTLESLAREFLKTADIHAYEGSEWAGIAERMRRVLGGVHYSVPTTASAVIPEGFGESHEDCGPYE